MKQDLATPQVPCLTFENLSAVQGLVHAVFTRHGGVSMPPYESLNVSWSNGDSPAAVLENITRIRKAIGLERLVSSRQVHGESLNFIGKDSVKALKPLTAASAEGAGKVFSNFTPTPSRSPDCGFRPHPESTEKNLPDLTSSELSLNPTADPQALLAPSGDALATDLSGFGLMIKIADCQSILLADPQSRIIANIHSGWRGSVRNIAGKTVKALERFGLDPKKTLAAVSPSLGPCCAEFVNYLAEIPEELRGFQVRPHYFDFWAITRAQLTAAGIEDGNIEIAQKCTVCGKADFFSYRAEGRTGRMSSVIGWV